MEFAFAGLGLLILGVVIISIAELLYDYLIRINPSGLIDTIVNAFGYALVFAGIIILLTFIILDLIVYDGKLYLQ